MQTHRLMRFRIGFVALACISCSFALPSTCATPQSPVTRVALIVGDTSSAAALTAIHQLAQDPDARGVSVKLFIKSQLSESDHDFVRRSDIVIAYPRFSSLVRELLPSIKSAIDSGALIAGVGPTIESEFTEQGIVRHPTLSAYFEAGGSSNLYHMLLAALSERGLLSRSIPKPQEFPNFGYFDPSSGRSFEKIEDLMRYHAEVRPSTPATDHNSTVGVYLSRETAIGGDTELLSSIEMALQSRGLNAIFAFGYPGHEGIPRLFIDDQGKSRIAALVALTLKIGNVPEKIVPVLEQLNVPVINAIALNSQTQAQWRESTVGLDLIERSWQVGLSEFAGTISPTVVASRETVVDAASGQAYAMQIPLPGRVDRLADRVAAWVRLRRSKPSQRRVAMIYYNYPPGRESIGASYLNVLPNSLKVILDELKLQNYELGDCPNDAEQLFAAVHAFGSNPPADSSASAELDRMVASRRIQLVPLQVYRRWFDRLPQKLRASIIDQWGQPEQASLMTWQDDVGEKYFVLPVLQFGNIVLGPQPTRGWQHDISAAYHDITLPPHHQYLAFYYWMQNVFRADVMLHVGTHATHEWLPGREVGFDADDAGETIVGRLPQLYLYIVDDVGEGLQAKRRGMATIITHQTPPLDQATLSPDLRELASLISDLSLAKDKGSLSVDELRSAITSRSRKQGLLTDLSIELSQEQLLSDQDIEKVEHHLKRVGERLTPFGMHTFGQATSAAAKQATVNAMLSVESELNAAQRDQRSVELLHLLEQSGELEKKSLLSGLSGGYIAAGPGGDPIRNSDVLPTGKNFYGFDPSRMPSPATFAAGERLATQFIDEFKASHQEQFPERLVFNLWGSESSRHEGVIEAQILSLMGVRPIWDSRGRVQDVELIQVGELGRQRVDVTIIPSGLYRDLFSKLMLLMDKAVDVVKQDNTPDNPLLRNIARVREQLIAQGIEPEFANRLASVRIFSLPSGAYGAGLDHVIQAEQSWTDSSEVNAVFMNRMSHLFGQGFWGTRAKDAAGNSDLSPQLLRSALQGAQGVIHSRSSNVYGAIDSDDFYQYLGGTAQAVRMANEGQSVDVYVADLSHPRESETLTLEKYMGRELRARYLNPKWINAMLGEGYAGSRMIRQVVDNMWGWQVTVPEAVDAAKWQELYETYVEDRHQLNISDRFAESRNLAAYKAIVERMQSVIAKDYWRPDAEVTNKLQQLSAELERAVEQEHSSIAATASLQPAPESIAVAHQSLSEAGDTSTTDHPLPDAAPGDPFNQLSGAPAAAKLQNSASGRVEASTTQLMQMVRGFAVETTAATGEQEKSDADSQAVAEGRWLPHMLLAAICLLVGCGWLLPTDNQRSATQKKCTSTGSDQA